MGQFLLCSSFIIYITLLDCVKEREGQRPLPPNFDPPGPSCRFDTRLNFPPRDEGEFWPSLGGEKCGPYDVEGAFSSPIDSIGIILALFLASRLPKQRSASRNYRKSPSMIAFPLNLCAQGAPKACRNIKLCQTEDINEKHGRSLAEDLCRRQTREEWHRRTRISYVYFHRWLVKAAKLAHKAYYLRNSLLESPFRKEWEPEPEAPISDYNDFSIACMIMSMDFLISIARSQRQGGLT